ncbi:MAG: radical SAM protein [bacterium]
MDDRQRTVQVQEAAAHERRHWVRICYVCNNRCCFCLDADLVYLDPFVLPEKVREQIDEGRALGATRLILSGGEASIHPDFVELVAYGKRVGYERIQTITNGRMFTYPQFLRQAVEAGLGEITFSLHSHRARIHDTITGVPGAFDQAFGALRRALAEPRLVVSVDIVLNRLNVDTLPETVAFFSEVGVREFDLLHLVPFGRAFSTEQGGVPLAVDQSLLRERLATTIALARERELVLWTNRLPAPVLEGQEHLIQDPHKLVDEVRGRHEHLSRLVEIGTPLPCRDERCDCCYLVHFCDELHPLQERIAELELPALRITLGVRGPLPDLGRYPSVERLWIRAPSVARALALQAGAAREIWELDSWDGLREALPERRVERLVVRSVAALEAALGAGVAEVKLLLDRHTWPWVVERADSLPAELVLGVEVPGRLSQTLDDMIDLQSPLLRKLQGRGVRIEDLPPCVGGALPGPEPGFVDLEIIDDAGRLDPDRYAEIYIREAYRTHSLRCGECSHYERCPGLHVNLIRAQGFEVLRPE